MGVIGSTVMKGSVGQMGSASDKGLSGGDRGSVGQMGSANDKGLSGGDRIYSDEGLSGTDGICNQQRAEWG